MSESTFYDHFRDILPILAVAAAAGGWIQTTRQLEEIATEQRISIEKIDARLQAHEMSDGHAGSRLRIERVERDIGDMRRDLKDIGADTESMSRNVLVLCSRVGKPGDCSGQRK